VKPLSDEAVRHAVEAFEIHGDLAKVEPYRRGHIHDTFVSTWNGIGGEKRYLHQRINDEVFRNVPVLMHNIHRVTEHLRSEAAEVGVGEGELETLDLVPARNGNVFLQTSTGPWRTYLYVEGTTSYDQCQGPEQAYQAARAFGQFQARLIGLDAKDLGETIPRFFDSRHRMQQLEEAITDDVADRAEGCAREIDFALERRAMVEVVENRLRSGRWPRRVIHGDTKLNNILFDQETGAARCIVDLDTCMPGYSLYDFGDLVRFTAATSSEDERDLDKVAMDPELYRALASGYLEHASAFLTEDEVRHLPFAARLVTLTVGLRFLADHLAGDVYFKTAREGHNLDRARVQLKLVASME